MLCGPHPVPVIRVSACGRLPPPRVRVEIQPSHHSGHRVVLCGQCLGCAVVALPVHEHAVGERATDVHADVVHGSTPSTKLNETDPFLRFVDHRGFACLATMTISTEGSDVVTAGA